MKYSKILDTHHARKQGLSQSECVRILMSAGATYHQAKNGAYVYIHHGAHMRSNMDGTQEEYAKILDDFNATARMRKECINHLEELGYSYGQANSAVYNYRKRRGLIKQH